MKKKLLLVAILFFSFYFSQAQTEQNQDETLKPLRGDITTELTLSLFNQGFTFYNPGASLGPFIGLVKARYFKSDNTALRFGFNLTHDSQKHKPLSSDITSSQTSIWLLSTTTGIEKHFSGTKKLSPYIGAEIGFTTTFVKSNSIGPDKEIFVTNGYLNDNQNPTGRPGYNQIGLNAIAGADYYFVKRFYLGIELGYGIQYNISKKITIRENGITTYEDKGKGFRQIAFGAYANPGLRVGFVF